MVAHSQNQVDKASEQFKFTRKSKVSFLFGKLTGVAQGLLYYFDAHKYHQTLHLNITTKGNPAQIRIRKVILQSLEQGL